MSIDAEKAISGGQLVIDVYYYGAHIHSETHDLCEETSCPVSSGDFILSHSQSLPGFTPPVSPLPHWFWDSSSWVPLLDVLSGTEYVKMFHKFASGVSRENLGMLGLPCSAVHIVYTWSHSFRGWFFHMTSLAWQTLTWPANLTRIRPT